MMYRTWRGLRSGVRGRKVIDDWRAEFRGYYRGEGAAGHHVLTRQIRGPEHFKQIPAGECPFGADAMNNDPGRPISVGAFRLHEWAVTNGMYELFAGNHRGNRWRERSEPPKKHPSSGTPDEDRCPAVNVSWYDAWCFSRWVGCRLPGEEEWEQAGRGGQGGRRYWSGDAEEDLARVAWYGGNSGRRTHVVGEKGEVHPFGVFDILGNVWELCQTPRGSYRGAVH